MSVNFRTVEILNEIKKLILMRGYDNVDWVVFESWVNDLITEENEGNPYENAEKEESYRSYGCL